MGLDISLSPQILFYIADFPISNTFFWSFFVFIFLIVGAIIFKSRIKMVPGRFQNLAEMAIEGAYGFVESITGSSKKLRESFRWYLPCSFLYSFQIF